MPPKHREHLPNLEHSHCVPKNVIKMRLTNFEHTTHTGGTLHRRSPAPKAGT